MNFDVSGPKDFEDFKYSMAMRDQRGDTVWAALSDGEPVGIIGFQRLADHLGVLAGLCFSSKVHGTAVTSGCLALALDQMFSTGISKLSATHFSDNCRVSKFLAKHGFVKEGVMVKHAVRDGRAINMDLVALFR